MPLAFASLTSVAFIVRRTTSPYFGIDAPTLRGDNGAATARSLAMPYFRAGNTVNPDEAILCLRSGIAKSMRANEGHESHWDSRMLDKLIALTLHDAELLIALQTHR